MSRIGKLKIDVPSSVKLNISNNNVVNVEGPKGKMNLNVNPVIKIENNENALQLSCDSNERKDKSLHGLYRVLLSNMVIGVSKGFEKKLEIIGTGYKSNVQGKKLILNVGYSHPIEFDIPEGIEIKVEDNIKVFVTGIDKQLVCQVASNIRKFRPPEPYKGKGIKYADEIIRRKAGKAAK